MPERSSWSTKDQQRGVGFPLQQRVEECSTQDKE